MSCGHATCGQYSDSKATREYRSRATHRGLAPPRPRAARTRQRQPEPRKRLGCGHGAARQALTPPVARRTRGPRGRLVRTGSDTRPAAQRASHKRACALCPPPARRRRRVLPTSIVRARGRSARRRCVPERVAPRRSGSRGGAHAVERGRERVPQDLLLPRERERRAARACGGVRDKGVPTASSVEAVEGRGRRRALGRRVERATRGTDAAAVRARPRHWPRRRIPSRATFAPRAPLALAVESRKCDQVLSEAPHLVVARAQQRPDALLERAKVALRAVRALLVELRGDLGIADVVRQAAQAGIEAGRRVDERVHARDELVTGSVGAAAKVRLELVERGEEQAVVLLCVGCTRSSASSPAMSMVNEPTEDALSASAVGETVRARRRRCGWERSATRALGRSRALLGGRGRRSRRERLVERRSSAVGRCRNDALAG